ncbi:hypothetical protein D0809_05535 [Flavobacterium circumlabens]|uniref:Uncharacterized protein n=1 Tax=Flavobacterium circumlabens TaxID=2133765 RepID=A0A4Y7UE87_9FLAO|nr:hypothetical protein D0809_05535 [Flavobacterium circumlabens]
MFWIGNWYLIIPIFKTLNYGAKLTRSKNSKSDFYHIMAVKKQITKIIVLSFISIEVFIYQIKNKKLHL